MRINKHDTQGTKPLLGKGELGYDDYQAGGDAGRVYVGTGTENIPVAKKSEVMAVDSKADAHIARVDNPHGVTKAQVGLDLVDNTADGSKNVLSATKWTTARTITLSGDIAGSASVDGSANVTIATTVQPNSVALGTDTTGNYVAGVTAGTGISISGTAGEGWSPTITNTAPNVTTDITTTHNATNVVVNSSDGTDGTINGATQTLAGVMTAADKVKLDGVATGATANVGTVTSIATSGAITGGTITSTGTISHSTSDGYLHVPATGTTNNGKVLTAGATAGSLSWTTIPSAPVTSVAGKTGVVTLVKGDVGLSNVDNTSDANKPISTATQNALDTKVDTSTNQTIGGVKTFSSTIAGSISGNAETATKLTTARTISLTGDVTGSVLFDGSADASISATIAANSVALGTDTTGNYVAGVTAGQGITISGTAGEGWSPTIAITNVGTAGTYRSVTTDAQGRVTAGTNPTTLSGYGITDAQTASRTSATFTTAANTWYRIATSVVGIERNSAEFVVDWTVGNNHGSIRFAAACHFGESAGVSLMQTNYAKYGPGGITEARIVYHTTYTGNYAYVEVKFAAALTSVVVNVEMQDTIGWTLVTPSTAGSIPSGYSSYVHTFVPSAAITAGTYPKITINQEGRVTSGSNLLATDIPSLDASKITTGTLPVVQGGTGVTTSTGTGSVVLSTSPILTTPNIGVATGTSFNSITGLASVAPLVAGTAAVGTSTLTARQDHVHPAQTSVTGNAGTATTLQTARTIGASGDVTGTATSFNGSVDITIPMTLSNSGVTAGTYSKVTVDAKGRVTAGLTPTMEDIPDATFKRSVRCATTANITLSGTQTIDGIAVVAGDRVLVKNQTTTSQNGIYVVAASTWARALDANSSSKIASAIVAVDSGTVNGGKLFDNDFKTTDTLDTTSMLWNMNIDDGSLLTAGSTSVGIVKYNGTTAAAGNFDGGTTTPTGTTRLNYGGYFYPTYLNLVGSVDTTTASSHVFVETGTDGFVRPKTLANFKTEIFASPTLVTPNIGVATGTSFNSITGLSATTPLMNGTAAVGTGVTVARADHVHPIDTSRAPLVSPAFTGTPTVNNVAFSGYSGFKNYIINGDFRVNQYGLLPLNVTSSTGAMAYIDNWRCANTGPGVLTVSMDTITYNGTVYKALKALTTTIMPDTNIVYAHYTSIEDKNCFTLRNKPFTVSFLCEVNYAGNYSLNIRKNDDSAVTTSYVKLVPLVVGVNKVEVSIPADNNYISNNSSSGRGLNICFGINAGNSATNTGEGWQSGNFAGHANTFKWWGIAGAYIKIANFQLEEGSVATPFEQRPYGLELSLCQRYYQVGTGTIKKHSTSGLHHGTQPLSIPLLMRAAPTISFSKIGVITSDNALEYDIAKDRLFIYGGTDYSAASVGDYTFFDFNASAEL